MNQRRFFLFVFCFLLFAFLFAENILEIVWQKEGEQQDDKFGKYIAALDFNGDGINDLAVSAPRYAMNPEYPSYKGKIYIYYGSNDGLSENPDWTFTQATDSTYIFITNCSRLVNLGDMDNNGCDDIGFYAFSSPQSGIYDWDVNIILGASNPDSLPDFIYNFSGSIETLNPLGDINGDGFDDVGVIEEIGSDYYTYYFIYGGSFELVPFVENVYSRNGIGFRGLGDLNSNGYDEFSYYFETDRVTIQDTCYYSHHNRFFWGATEQDTIPDYSLDLLMLSPWAELVQAGDWNGDGYADFALSGWELTGQDEGGCRLWLGGEQIDWSSYYHMFYFSDFFPSFGDIDNDGKGDLIEIYQYFGLGGYLYFYLGDQNGTYDYNAFYDEEGFSPEVVGDFNNDGFDDIAVGAMGDISWPDYGKAYVFAGHSGLIEQNPNINVEEEIIPKVNITFNAYPNPFNPTTTISFSIPEESKVGIEIYNIKGQKVKQLVDEQLSEGIHSVIWDGKNDSSKSVSSGVYFYKLKVNSKDKAIKKCLLLK